MYKKAFLILIAPVSLDLKKCVPASYSFIPFISYSPKAAAALVLGLCLWLVDVPPHLIQTDSISHQQINPCPNLIVTAATATKCARTNNTEEDTQEEEEEVDKMGRRT